MDVKEKYVLFQFKFSGSAHGQASIQQPHVPSPSPILSKVPSNPPHSLSHTHTPDFLFLFFPFTSCVCFIIFLFN